MFVLLQHQIHQSFFNFLKFNSMKRKPVTRAARMKDDALMQFAEQVCAKMALAVEIFPTPQPSIALIEESLVAFRQSATDAAHRDTRAIRVRKERRFSLIYLLAELSKYVDTVANGSDTMILASGFLLSDLPSNFGGLVPKATRLTAEPYQVGSSKVKLRVQRWQGARMYEYQFRKKGADTAWKSVLGSKSAQVIEGLERFEEYEFRASYIGIHPEPSYSDIVSSYAL